MNLDDIDEWPKASYGKTGKREEEGVYVGEGRGNHIFLTRPLSECQMESKRSNCYVYSSSEKRSVCERRAKKKRKVKKGVFLFSAYFPLFIKFSLYEVCIVTK